MKTAIASLCAVVASAGCTTIHKSAPAHDTLISHRGESHDAPENAIPAYRMAFARGVDTVTANRAKYMLDALCGKWAGRKNAGEMERMP